MTLSSLRRRSFEDLEAQAQVQTFEVEPGTCVTGRWNGQADPDAPVLVLQHGLGGSVDSNYMGGTASLGKARGFAVLRVNARNCGGTEALSRTFHHGAQWSDIARVIEQVDAARPGRNFHLAGFSLGGALSLQLAIQAPGEWPSGLRSVCAVSPPLDFEASTSHLERNWLGRLAGIRFTRTLKAMVAERARHHGVAVDPQALANVRTVREFDTLVTAPLGGFDSLEHYYRTGSVAGRMGTLGLPTRLIQALDDPLIPATQAIELGTAPPKLLDLHLVPHGGHVAFRARQPATGAFGLDPSPWWAEARVVEFAQSIEASLLGDSSLGLASGGVPIADRPRSV